MEEAGTTPRAYELDNYMQLRASYSFRLLYLFAVVEAVAAVDAVVSIVGFACAAATCFVVDCVASLAGLGSVG